MSHFVYWILCNLLHWKCWLSGRRFELYILEFTLVISITYSLHLISSLSFIWKSVSYYIYYVAYSYGNYKTNKEVSYFSFLRYIDVYVTELYIFMHHLFKLPYCVQAQFTFVLIFYEIKSCKLMHTTNWYNITSTENRWHLHISVHY